jgi:protein-S-isoprenylcysteine O-methyltransferase Ste14
VTDAAIERSVTPTVARTANVLAKGALVLLLVFAVAHPDQAHLRDKAAGMRAIGYPLVSFTVPVLWWTLWRDRISFPWLPDLLITITCPPTSSATGWTSTTRSCGSTTGCT